jgi:hypothetical protein
VIRWIFEFTYPDGSRMRIEELAYQRWEGERIAEERFFYDPAQLKPQALHRHVGDRVEAHVLRAHEAAETAHAGNIRRRNADLGAEAPRQGFGLVHVVHREVGAPGGLVHGHALGRLHDPRDEVVPSLKVV